MSIMTLGVQILLMKLRLVFGTLLLTNNNNDVYTICSPLPAIGIVRQAEIGWSTDRAG